MSKYSLEIRQIVKKINLFDFNYRFYEDSFKKEFEDRFIEHFYFNEIGFETVGRFKHMLMSKLNDIYPYYKQLYEIELKSKNINYLMNKDLKETVIKEVTGSLKSSEKGSSNSNGTSSNNSTSNSLDKGSDTPQGRVENLDDYLTTATVSENTSLTNDSSTSNTSTQGETIQDNEGRETTTLISQGNIGVVSSAKLLEEYRKTIININMMIFNDLECLFMGLY